jgi:hypothetical protein
MKGDIGPITLQKSELLEYAWFSLDAIPEDTMACCKQKAEDLKNFQGEIFFR